MTNAPTTAPGRLSPPSGPGIAPVASATRGQVIAGYAVIYLVWGSTYLAIAYAVQSLPPVLTTGARFAAAGLALCSYAWLRGAPRPSWTQWRAATIAGALLLVGGTATVCWAEQWVPSGLASLLVATVPLWFALLEWAVPGGQRPRGLVVAGIALGLVGLIVLTAPSSTGATNPRSVALAAVLTVAAILWAAGSLYSRYAPLPASPTLAMGMQMMTGGVLCIAVGFALGESAAIDVAHVSRASWIAVAYLTIAGCLLAFTTYLWLLRVSTPARVATHAYINPVVAVALGWAIAKEPVTLRTLGAAVLIVGAVVLITSGQRDIAGTAEHPAFATEPS